MVRVRSNLSGHEGAALDAYHQNQKNLSAMKTITTLKIIFSVVLVWMAYVVISTSLASSLFEQWDFLGAIPWMRATLWDFYANILIIALWMFYKEKYIPIKILWTILFVCLGSLATCAYVLIKLFKLKPGQGVKELLVER
ncbi:DUF1475 family protein [Pedobacter sp. ASV12]|uniref:DUF1475 family protein n=1 Tax=Pedobacter sp. ASV12 TaxID=2795120 RepID=UPI0018EDC88B